MLNSKKTKTILITGGAGFIGSNLCERLLKESYSVVCLDNLSTGHIDNIRELLGNEQFSFLEGDITNYQTCLDAMIGVDLILHQAALGSVPRSIEDPINTNRTNIDGFLNMLTAAKESGIKRFVYAASSSTYGDSKSLPKVEENIGAPLSPYAVTKYVNELYAKVFSDLYGLETIGLRYFNVFGRRQSPNGAYAAAIPKFVEALINKQSPTIHGDGEQSRDFTYIENVIEANLCAMTTSNPEALNTVYNVAYGESTTLNELTQLLKNLLSKYDPEISSVDILHGPNRIGDIKHSLADISKAKKLLGYSPAYDINKGMQEAIDWYWNTLR